ncbi:MULTISPECIES: ABC transporter substrate-binding protein [unclassified Hyphomicrobium]|uniref:ABC transporter substrate-binding protein n=1 Tax=unclassified Hyphomicrobium TaxID=2619925 RepID=UPI00045E6699|nr:MULTISPECIES: extracellular solute-binding protein [unclassified Hyphomicrobium]
MLSFRRSICAVIPLALSFFTNLASTSAEAWDLTEAAKPYSGATVNMACEAYAPCIAYQKLIPEFQKATGINVHVEAGDIGQIQQQILTDALTGTQIYDLVQINPFSTGVWGGQKFATPVQPFLDDAKLRDPSFKIEDIVPALVTQMKYKGELIAMPYSFLPPFGIYRKDIAADPGEQAAFKAKFGYDTPFNGDKIVNVDDWQKWTDAASFFGRKAGEKLAGQTLDHPVYGTAAAFKRHLTVIFDYERMLLSMGGEMISADGKEGFSSPVAKKALDTMLSWRAYSPPSYREYTWDEEYADFCAGNLFSVPSWADSTAFFEMPKECPKVAGKVGYFLHPGNHKTVSEGHAFVIPKQSQNKEAAFLLAQWLASKDVQERCEAFGCATFRKDVLAQSKWDDSGPVQLFREMIAKNYLYPRPALPEWIEMQQVIMEHLSAAGADQEKPDVALNAIAEKAKEVMKK